MVSADNLPVVTIQEKIRSRVRRYLSPSATGVDVSAKVLPPEFAQQGSRRPVPLPDGWTHERVFALLQTVSIDLAPPAEIEGYLRQDFDRFLHTWNLVKDESGTVLEIGANPYFTSGLLREFTALEHTMTNNIDVAVTGMCSQRVSYTGADGISKDHVFEYQSLNVENSTFPYPDETFDVVVFCEVLEHLQMDPVAALHEMRRVLKPSGVLLVSTPNVARLENVARLIAGVNVYDPYSGYGPYGRHNREYTRHELVRLLGFAGFDPDEHFTVDVHQHQSDLYANPRVLCSVIPEDRLPDLGQYIFCRATKNSDVPRSDRPTELYRSVHDVELASWD